MSTYFRSDAEFGARKLRTGAGPDCLRRGWRLMIKTHLAERSTPRMVHQAWTEMSRRYRDRPADRYIARICLQNARDARRHIADVLPA